MPFLTTFTIAALGGFIAHTLGLPLPWIFGSMVAMLLALRFTHQLAIDKQATAAANIIWGLMIGSYVRPNLISDMITWWPSLLGLAAYVLIGAFINFRIARRHYDAPTAYFMSIPGGLNEMYTVGTAMGADGRVVAITQTLRAFFIVTLLPILLHFQLPAATLAANAVPAVRLPDYLCLAIAALGSWGAVKMNWPAAMLTGAAVGSGIVHGFGLTASGPPLPFLVVAQIVIGAGIGLGFKNFTLAEIRRALAIALIAAILFFALGGLFAWGASYFMHLNIYDALVSYTPGGIATMSIVAVTHGLNVPFIALHHIIRLIGILVVAPLLYRQHIKN